MYTGKLLRLVLVVHVQGLTGRSTIGRHTATESRAALAETTTAMARTSWPTHSGARTSARSVCGGSRCPVRGCRRALEGSVATSAK